MTRRARAAATRLRVVAAAAVALSALGACADDGLRFEGETGQPATLTLTNWVPRIPVSVDGVEGLALLDTGAPVSIAFASDFPALKRDTTARVDSRAFGLRFPELTVGVLAGNGPGSCAEPQHGAILGQNVLGQFRLHLDYRGRRAILTEPGGVDPKADNVEAPVHVAGQRLGRGFISFGGAGIDIGASRLIVEVEVEGKPVKALVDTGASLTVISQSLLDRLGNGGSPARPRLCCTLVELLADRVDAQTVRLERMLIGPAGSGDGNGSGAAQRVDVRNVPVLVLPNRQLFSPLSLEIGEPIEMILGASPLRRFALDIDLGAATLTMSRYRDQSHIGDDEYVAPGFSFCKSRDVPGAMRIIDVFENSDAKRLGVAAGALFTAVNGVPVASMTSSEVLALMRKTPVGQTVTLTFRSASGGATTERKIAMERLLGDYR